MDCAVALSCSTAVIDGEVIVQDECGVSDFPALRRAMAREPHHLGFFAFDVLHLNGADLRGGLWSSVVPCSGICSARTTRPAQSSSRKHLPAKGPQSSPWRTEWDLKGIVSKRADSKYRSGSSKAWLKTKCMTEGEFVVIGTSGIRAGHPSPWWRARMRAGVLMLAVPLSHSAAQPAMRSGCGRKSSLR
jgi:ATP-dependent DNA ligase